MTSKSVEWDKIVAFDEKHIKDNLLKTEIEYAKKLANEIKLITSCIERCKRERRFLDDDYETPEIKFKFSQPQVSVNDEIKNIKAENHKIEVMLKSLAQMFIDKNNSIYDNRKLAQEIEDLFVLPEGVNDNHKDFNSLKSMLQIYYKNIIKLTLDRIELEMKTKAIEKKGKELSEKYNFLYYYTKDSQNLTEHDSLIASINSIDVENTFLQFEIERIIIEIEEIQKDFKRFDNLSLDEMNHICAETVRHNIRLIHLLYEDKHKLKCNSADELLERGFTDDYHFDEHDYYGADIAKMIPIKRKHTKEINELTYKLSKLKKNALKEKHLN